MTENVQNRLEEVEQKALGPGRMLREARKVQQIDQQELATRLNLDLRLVDAVERDDFEHMPPATFIKGYLRAYAREVGLSPDAVVEEFDRVSATQDMPTLKSRHSVQRQADLSDSPMRWVSIALVLILIGLVGTWVVRNFQPGEPEAPVAGEESMAEVQQQPEPLGEVAAVGASEDYQPPAEEQSAEAATASDSAQMGSETTETTEPVAVEPPSSDETSSTEGSTPAETVETAETAADSADDQTPVAEASEEVASTEPQETATTSVAVADRPESAQTSESAAEANIQQAAAEVTESAPVVDPDAPLIMRFTDDCWTSVQAADGERLVYRVVKKGAVLNIHGEAPFRITLGNSDVVKVVYQGDLIDHQPFSRGKIARFVLNADGSAN